MTKSMGLTFAQEPEDNELSVAQLDDLCGKCSVLVTKERRVPFTLVQI